ncbi:hypothetical protein PROFUN_14601, partial [Planoprotostelium fungivorum]
MIGWYEWSTLDTRTYSPFLPVRSAIGSVIQNEDDINPPGWKFGKNRALTRYVSTTARFKVSSKLLLNKRATWSRAINGLLFRPIFSASSNGGRCLRSSRQSNDGVCRGRRRPTEHQAGFLSARYESSVANRRNGAERGVSGDGGSFRASQLKPSDEHKYLYQEGISQNLCRQENVEVRNNGEWKEEKFELELTGGEDEWINDLLIDLRLEALQRRKLQEIELKAANRNEGKQEDNQEVNEMERSNGESVETHVEQEGDGVRNCLTKDNAEKMKIKGEFLSSQEIYISSPKSLEMGVKLIDEILSQGVEDVKKTEVEAAATILESIENTCKKICQNQCTIEKLGEMLKSFCQLSALVQLSAYVKQRTAIMILISYIKLRGETDIPFTWPGHMLHQVSSSDKVSQTINDDEKYLRHDRCLRDHKVILHLRGKSSKQGVHPIHVIWRAAMDKYLSICEEIEDRKTDMWKQIQPRVSELDGMSQPEVVTQIVEMYVYGEKNKQRGLKQSKLSAEAIGEKEATHDDGVDVREKHKEERIIEEDIVGNEAEDSEMLSLDEMKEKKREAVVDDDEEEEDSEEEDSEEEKEEEEREEEEKEEENKERKKRRKRVDDGEEEEEARKKRVVEEEEEEEEEKEEEEREEEEREEEEREEEEREEEREEEEREEEEREEEEKEEEDKERKKRRRVDDGAEEQEEEREKRAVEEEEEEEKEEEKGEEKEEEEEKERKKRRKRAVDDEKEEEEDRKRRKRDDDSKEEDKKRKTKKSVRQREDGKKRRTIKKSAASKRDQETESEVEEDLVERVSSLDEANEVSHLSSSELRVEDTWKYNPRGKLFHSRMFDVLTPKAPREQQDCEEEVLVREMNNELKPFGLVLRGEAGTLREITEALPSPESDRIATADFQKDHEDEDSLEYLEAYAVARELRVTLVIHELYGGEHHTAILRGGEPNKKILRVAHLNRRKDGYYKVVEEGEITILEHAKRVHEEVTGEWLVENISDQQRPVLVENFPNSSAFSSKEKFLKLGEGARVDAKDKIKISLRKGHEEIEEEVAVHEAIGKIVNYASKGYY